MNFALERLECYRGNQGNFSPRSSIRTCLWGVPRGWKARCEVLQNTALNVSSGYCQGQLSSGSNQCGLGFLNFVLPVCKAKEIWWCFSFSSNSNTSFVLPQSGLFFPPVSFSLVFIQWFVFFALPGWDPWEDLSDSLCGCISSGNRCHFWGNKSLAKTALKILSILFFLTSFCCCLPSEVLCSLEGLTASREERLLESLGIILKFRNLFSSCSRWSPTLQPSLHDYFTRAKHFPAAPSLNLSQKLLQKSVFCLVASSCECSLCRSWALACRDSKILAWC